MGGKAWFNALHPEDRDYCLTVFKDAFKTYKSFTMEYRLRCRDGEYRHFIDHGEPYIDGHGRFSGFVGSSTDITEQKLSEDELKKSHQELTQYNYEMNLINQLNSYLQVCRQCRCKIGGHMGTGPETQDRTIPTYKQKKGHTQ